MNFLNLFSVVFLAILVLILLFYQKSGMIKKNIQIEKARKTSLKPLNIS